jgi:hypothetical protein
MTRGSRGSLNTARVIEHGGCSIIAEFLRRVQAVIWRRCLIRTTNDHLRLVHKQAKVGDRVCILYGCSVPVILQRFEKTKEEIALERKEAEEERDKKTREAVVKIRDVLRERRERMVHEEEQAD